MVELERWCGIRDGEREYEGSNESRFVREDKGDKGGGEAKGSKGGTSCERKVFGVCCEDAGAACERSGVDVEFVRGEVVELAEEMGCELGGEDEEVTLEE